MTATSPLTVALHGAPLLRQHALHLHHVAGDHLALEAGVMDPAQKGQLALVLRQGQDGHAAHLGHGLDE